jgi:sigma-B regulation protein RsbU (phosphoserine phosphatase)
MAAVLTLRDVSAEQAADQHLQAWMLAVGLLCLTVLTGLLFVYLRHALKPLERSVEVLAELSRGQLAVALDGLEAFRNDEAGQIVKGVTVLRGEMLNLKMLRDERTRSRHQQERLIRNQLKQLAGSRMNAPGPKYCTPWDRMMAGG